MYVALAMAAFQMISGAQQAEVVRANAELSKQVNDMNAEFAEIDAFNAENTGRAEEARYQTTIDQTVGAQKVALASKDVDINFGTAKELQNQTKLTGFLNQIDIRNQAHNQALGYKGQARNLKLASYTQAAEAALQAGAIQSSSMMRGAETVISGAQKEGYLGENTGKGSSGYSKVKTRVT